MTDLLAEVLYADAMCSGGLIATAWKCSCSNSACIAMGMAAGPFKLAYSNLTNQVNALVQLEEGSCALALLSSPAAPVDSNLRSVTEIEILHSLMVPGRTVDDLNLGGRDTLCRVPLVGNLMSLQKQPGRARTSTMIMLPQATVYRLPAVAEAAGRAPRMVDAPNAQSLREGGSYPGNRPMVSALKAGRPKP